MLELQHRKTTFQVTGNNYQNLKSTIDTVEKEYNVKLTRTSLINVAISELYKDLEKKDKDLIGTLTSYNLIWTVGGLRWWIL